MSKIVIWKSRDPQNYVLAMKSGQRFFEFVSIFEDYLYDIVGEDTYNLVVDKLKDKDSIEVDITLIAY